MTVGILAVQGAFAEHEAMLDRLGAPSVELRSARDLGRDFDRLVLPGGESTVQTRLLREQGMLEPLRRSMREGMPVLATCAGLILLAAEVVGGEPCFGTLGVRVRRNAYGRQLGSFHASSAVAGVGKDVPMTFIRAPYVEAILRTAGAPEATALARVDGRIVGVRQQNLLAFAFHPELDQDTRIHELFLSL